MRISVHLGVDRKHASCRLLNQIVDVLWASALSTTDGSRCILSATLVFGFVIASNVSFTECHWSYVVVHKRALSPSCSRDKMTRCTPTSVRVKRNEGLL